VVGSLARDPLDHVRSELERDGRFRVIARIGAGGMGVVYRVHDHERGEDVALKTLRLPSPGAIYPTLQLLQDEGLIAGDEVDGKKVFTLTSSGLTAANELTAGRTAPWDDATANAGEGPMALRKALVAVVHGIKQVSLIGTPDQQTRAAALLDQARKGIYGILAEDADTEA
jgi:hypothetical protein